MYDASLGYKEAFLYAVPSLNSIVFTKEPSSYHGWRRANACCLLLSAAEFHPTFVIFNRINRILVSKLSSGWLWNLSSDFWGIFQIRSRMACPRTYLCPWACLHTYHTYVVWTLIEKTFDAFPFTRIPLRRGRANTGWYDRRLRSHAQCKYSIIRHPGVEMLQTLMYWPDIKW